MPWRIIADTRWALLKRRLAVSAGRPAETSWRDLAHAWTTPLYGLSIVAFTAPHMVAGLPLDLPHLPFWMPTLFGAAAAGLVFDWALKRAADWRLGELAPQPAAHLAAHHLVFLLGFGLMLDVSAGLVALIAWRLAYAAPLKLGAAQPNHSRPVGEHFRSPGPAPASVVFEAHADDGVGRAVWRARSCGPSPARGFRLSSLVYSCTSPPTIMRSPATMSRPMKRERTTLPRTRPRLWAMLRWRRTSSIGSWRSAS
ncbi:MAG: hypothetical protein R3C16_10795 [Hyphomonadaceae bacterium]